MWGLVFGLGFAVIVVLGCVFLFKRANSGRVQMSNEEDKEIELTWNVDEYCEKKFGRTFDEVELKELTKKWETNEQDLTNQIICIWMKKGLVQTADDMWGVESKARMAAINLQELGGVSRKVFQEYICKIDALVEPLVFDLLSEMMPRVLFNNIQEVKECGFFTPTAYRGSSDDIQAIKSLCLNKEKGYDLSNYYNGDDILPWNEILAIMRDKADEEKRAGKNNQGDILKEERRKQCKE